MKKFAKKTFLLLALFACLSLPGIALAQNPMQGLSNVVKNSGYAPASQTTLASIAGAVVNVVLSLLGIIFIILILYAGITWMTAEGDEAKVEKAQKILRNAIVGLVITIACWAIYLVVEKVFSPATVPPVQQTAPATQEPAPPTQETIPLG